MAMHTEAKDGATEPTGTTGPEALVSPAEPLSPGPGDDKGEAAVEAFARDHEGLTGDDERDALDFLLAPKPSRIYGVPVEYETEAGSRRLKFVVRAMDGRRLDAIEQANVSETTGKLDVISAECLLLSEAVVWLEGRPGHKVELSSDEFLTLRRVKQGAEGDEVEEMKLASPAEALEARFKTQLGLLSGVARQVRIVSGYDPQKVGQAQRRLAAAVGKP